MKMIIAACLAAASMFAGDIPAQVGSQANKPAEPVRCIYVGSQMCQIACVMGDGNVYCVEYAKLQQKPKAGDAILAALVAPAPALSACPRTGPVSNAPPSCYACHAWIPQPDCLPTLGTACPPPYRATL